MSLPELTARDLEAGEIVAWSGGRSIRARLADGVCRVLDIVIAMAMLVLLAPVMIGVAVLIRRDSPGPALFRQRRMGRGLEPFTVVKFRTMHDGVPHDSHRAFVLDLIAGAAPERQSDDGPRYKMTGDPRVTRLGRVLRRTSLDELPQLWNVLRGDMSLVGPRPSIPYEVEKYPPHWLARFAVKPGVTGLWQVSGRCELTLEQMVELDLEYVRRRTPWLNVWILLRTVPVVLSCRGAG
jgi:lipopolysaccharide/colanic/teichoic acid biosynthesis glycosyltransferase